MAYGLVGTIGAVKLIAGSWLAHERCPVLTEGRRAVAPWGDKYHGGWPVWAVR
jgi:hypothetical protein